MKIAITGPDGFIAWHTRAALHTRTGNDALLLGRAEFDDPELMDAILNKADAVVHLAGVNRTGDESEIAGVNRWLATQLVAGLRRTNRNIPLVYGNSIHKATDTVFGIAKSAAAETLKEWADETGAAFADVVLPNIYGEHGRPFYNSVVSTFCHQIANGNTPEIQVDREMSLLHVQRAAQILIDAAEQATAGTIEPKGTLVTVTGLLERLVRIRDAYLTADLPDLSDPFTRDLFNTYRSYTFPSQWPIYPEVRGDQRGELFEVVKSSGGEAQVFFSTTRPGFTRGQHFHLHKVERFLVLRGSGVIRLRKLFTEEVVEFPVSGDRPAIIDMPTMWVHSIVNTGDDELLTLFFADELFDPEYSDTYPEEV